MEEVECSCPKCKAKLGTYKNAWNGIGKAYYNPVFPSVTYISGLEATGNIYTATPGTPVEGCRLQDLACKCGFILGYRCDGAPEGHMLKKDQILLRLGDISVMSTSTREKAVILVRGRLILSASGLKKAATPQPTPQKVTGTYSSPYLPPTPQKANGTYSSPYPQIPSLSKEKSPLNIDDFKAWTQHALESQKMDIQCIGQAVERIEKGMNSFRSFMDEVRTDIAIIKQEGPNNDDIADICKDVRAARREIIDLKASQPHIILSNLAPIENNLMQLRKDFDSQTEIEVLKAEIEVIKSRIDSVARSINVAPADDPDLGESTHLQSLYPQILQQNLSTVYISRYPRQIFPNADLRSPSLDPPPSPQKRKADSPEHELPNKKTKCSDVPVVIQDVLGLRRNNLQVVIPLLTSPSAAAGTSSKLEKPFRCGVCGNRYKNAAYFKKHKQNFHCVDTTNDESAG